MSHRFRGHCNCAWFVCGWRSFALRRYRHRRGRPANVWTATQQECEYYLALARAKLTEPEFWAEETAGAVLSLEQALAYVQSLTLQITQKNTKMPDDLTMREREITSLIAQGKSNGEIADELVVKQTHGRKTHREYPVEVGVYNSRPNCTVGD